MNSIEWFAQEINKINVSTEARLFINKLKEQAKEMHRQETIEAWEMGRFNIDAIASGEEYYNETYKK